MKSPICFGLSGRVVMVTGGGSGIGRQCALDLAREGASVAIVDNDAAAAVAVGREVEALGTRVHVATLDVRDAAATDRVVGEAEASLGTFDGLITSAGISRPSLATDMSSELWETVIGVNLTGSFYSCQAVGKRMVKQGGGSIVTIGSISSVGAQAGRAHYCASKAGIVGLTRDLSLEWGSYGVRVNCVGPNATDTPMVRAGVPEAFIKDVMEDRTPLGRLSRPRDISNVCLFLLSDMSSYVTGALIMADGGVSTGYLNRRNGRDLSSRALLSQGVYSE